VLTIQYDKCISRSFHSICGPASANSRDFSLFFATSRNENQLRSFGAQPWERPIGFITRGQEVISKLYSGYGEIKEMGGKGPSQQELRKYGRISLDKKYPKLDSITSCRRSLRASGFERLAVSLGRWSKAALHARLHNKADQPIDVYFMPDGKKGLRQGIFRTTLKPGEIMEETSFSGHSFIWKEHGKRLSGNAQSKAQDRSVRIQHGVRDYHLEL